MDIEARDPERVIEAVQHRVGDSLEALVSVRAHARAVLESAIDEGRRPARRDLSGLGEFLRETLRHHGAAMDGVGVATTADYLEDSPYWLEWWRFDRDRELEFVAHTLNPTHDVFYDYASRPWFSVPVSSGEATVTGPYVDFGGTNTYTVTLALPVAVEGRIVGVAGADIHAAHFEEHLLPGSGPRRTAVLVSEDDRVIASNSADQLPGDRLDLGSGRGWRAVPVELGPGVGVSWRLFLRR